MRESPTFVDADELNGLSPLEVAHRWPVDARLVMLHSGRLHARWARWSVLACPVVTWRFTDRSSWVGSPPPCAQSVRFTHDPLTDLDAVLAATRVQNSDSVSRGSEQCPFAGGWIGHFSYDLGAWIEPRAKGPDTAKSPSDWPLIELAWCPAALVFDHADNTWQIVGDCEQILEHVLAGDASASVPDSALHPLQSTIGLVHYCEMVDRVIEYIRAGDVFQANIAQRLCSSFNGSMREVGLAALARSQAWYGGLLELARDEKNAQTLVSLSPELFLHVNPMTRQVTTRPIKGTRPSTSNVHELLDSAKDAAELHMIVDLMRNDLGRVCEYGSVRVPHARLIETHPTVHHGVGEITGTLHAGTTVGEILRATFPSGSVTGAPKIRAMQIIDELEQHSRGPYCGAIGMLGDDGSVTLNVAIRTLLLQQNACNASPDHGTAEYWVGAGIVADSNPLAEFHECMHKADVLASPTQTAKPCVSKHPNPAHV